MIGHGVAIADEFVQIRLGGDMALFAGLGRLLLEAEDASPGRIVDRQFIEKHCAGYEEWAERTRTVDWETVTRATGIDMAQLRTVADMLANSQRTIFCWAMGLPSTGTRCHHRRGDEPAVDARHDRQARCRGVPGARH